MRIDVIDTLPGFDALRESWDRVFMADPHAQHFLSWVWLRAYLKRRGRWLVLALREKQEGSPYVAFFPLRVVTQRDKKTGRFFDELIMAGNFAADYTGFVTLPDYENHAVAGFCSFIKEQRWTNLKLDYLSGPPSRRDAMIRALQGPLVMFRDNTPKSRNNINNSVCPVVALPATFDEYLETSMSSQTRQKLRRFLRRIENDDSYHITLATPETIKRDLNILFDLWRTRWAPIKGKEKTETLIYATREMLMDSFADGNLDVPVLWHGEQPLGALANIVDRQKGTILFYITGRDETWTTPSPGLILHGYCIRRAIEMGFKHYDFLRGNEPYKYMFGAEDRPVTCTLFRTRSGDNLQGKLHHFSVRFVYEQALKMYKKGDKGQAEIAFRQVLDTAPNHGGAEFGLANLSFEKGEFREAELSYLSISRKVADPIPALMRLGETRLAQRDYLGAVKAFQDVTKLAPFHHEALYKSGISLTAAGRRTEAAAIFEKLQNYHSDDMVNLQYAEKAKAALARIRTSAQPAETLSGSMLIAGSEAEQNRRWTPPKVLH
ncbi:GNAT family N-acetyltransferase [Agrobacterium sp. rho-13.3]|uniref:GNAT family N-acetyltransferase n=1 Tax=Agrobacterium sp. rho-13.3 TaxID=3072980 RepID=UPI002A159EF5|nr:GNAT family N-acetyltransferase [Agrobacterium sp. rho-13.3]MDX8306539.1 GNAT family N-acetyltransferase [Agrobacterium sp. rho-13.3]MDX8307130.1 GNAT family N-acetyltransferase [Agrobacterium sp. rho-13.3]